MSDILNSINLTTIIATTISTVITNITVFLAIRYTSRVVENAERKLGIKK